MIDMLIGLILIGLSSFLCTALAIIVNEVYSWRSKMAPRVIRIVRDSGIILFLLTFLTIAILEFYGYWR